ncbi:hypothetical protein L1049_007501 [Liquidambar formosana]|uniref:Uncharacterized protein n=1 Tax=Liquidambar formosana TaxID=63359 RepID=A0AAP0X402_LIQFO
MTTMPRVSSSLPLTERKLCSTPALSTTPSPISIAETPSTRDFDSYFVHQNESFCYQGCCFNGCRCLFLTCPLKSVSLIRAATWDGQPKINLKGKVLRPIFNTAQLPT